MDVLAGAPDSNAPQLLVLLIFRPCEARAVNPLSLVLNHRLKATTPLARRVGFSFSAPNAVGSSPPYKALARDSLGAGFCGCLRSHS